MNSPRSNQIDLINATNTLLAALDARSKDIVSRRYGIKAGNPETLEGIGREYGITRERVRQIQSQAKKVLVELSDVLEPIAELYQMVFTDLGGIMREQEAINAVEKNLQTKLTNPAIVAFYLDLLPPYQHITRDEYFGPHWRHPDVVSDKAVHMVVAARELLENLKNPIEQSELFNLIRKHLGESLVTLPDEHIFTQLTASKDIDSTPFGEWGLANWPEVNPRGVGDKAYAVLRRHGKPEHFTAITNLINQASFDHKQANAQTVHNELIKDNRFVLVGRGLYGLTEWGFISGTVADVIASILKKAQHPLSREEIIEQVLAQRQVKKNTILLGLQNQKRFTRTSDNRYKLR